MRVGCGLESATVDVHGACADGGGTSFHLIKREKGAVQRKEMASII